MNKIDELEKRIERLEKETNSHDWVWSRSSAEAAALDLQIAFHWDKCPKRPYAFATWAELHDWLVDVADDFEAI